MAEYRITTSRSDMAEVGVVTRHRVDAARQAYATLVWGVMHWGGACSIDRSPIVSSTRRRAPRPVTRPSSRLSSSVSPAFRS
jgi:hypothetical protein